MLLDIFCKISHTPADSIGQIFEKSARVFEYLQKESTGSS